MTPIDDKLVPLKKALGLQAPKEKAIKNQEYFEITRNAQAASRGTTDVTANIAGVSEGAAHTGPSLSHRAVRGGVPRARRAVRRERQEGSLYRRHRSRQPAPKRAQPPEHRPAGATGRSDG